MTTKTTAAPEPEEFAAEQSVRIYLLWDDVNNRWSVDPVSVDGYSLDGLDSAMSDLDTEFWTDANRTEIAAANDAALPNADQLVLLLIEALPETSTVKSSIAEILDGAQSWANELTEYIAPSSGKFADIESQENQTETARALRAAVELLRV